VKEGRLLVFLDVWEELRPRYQRWHELVEEGQHGQAKSWQDAKAALAATQDVQHAQIEILRSHRLSPAELLWLDDMVLSKRGVDQVRSPLSQAHGCEPRRAR
jgi:hypothetical protein